MFLRRLVRRKRCSDYLCLSVCVCVSVCLSVCLFICLCLWVRGKLVQGFMRLSKPQAVKAMSAICKFASPKPEMSNAESATGCSFGEHAHYAMQQLHFWEFRID